MSELSDSQLLQEYVQARSEPAFRELVRRHLDLVYMAALRQTHGRANLAEEVSQMVFIALVRKAPLLIRHPSVRGWLYLCTRHVASRLLRAEYRRLVRESTAQAMQDTLTSPIGEGEVIPPVLDDLLFRLKERDREVIFLRYFDKLSFAAIGARVGVGEDAARRRVERTLERLRALLAKRGVTSTASALGLVLTTEGLKAAPQELLPGVTRATLNAVSGGSAGLIPIVGALKAIALSTTFIALVGLTGLAAGGVGWYFHRELQHEEASAHATTAAVTKAEARLAEIRATVARGPGQSSGRGALLARKAALPASGSDLQIAHDLEYNRWREQQRVADMILVFGPFLSSHGISAQTIQKLEAAYGQFLANFDDVNEIARLAGVKIAQDADLLARAEELGQGWKATAYALLGTETAAAMSAYAGSIYGPNQNGSQIGEARWVTTEVAGVAFASGSPITTDARQQLNQLILKYTPDYPPGSNNAAETLDWDGLIAEAQQSLPVAQVAALQSYRAAVTIWAIEKQATAAAGGTPR